jgi:hypothetical protein
MRSASWFCRWLHPSSVSKIKPRRCHETLGFREGFAAVLRRPLLRAAPGRIDTVQWDHEVGRFLASGAGAADGQTLILFGHQEIDASAVTATGLADVRLESTVEPGQIWSARATDGTWSIEVTF